MAAPAADSARSSIFCPRAIFAIASPLYEALLSHLFQHRFHAGAGLSGHSFGNLFLTALTTITGDFAETVKQSSEILATRGHIYPSTVSDVQLEALMADGTRVVGETNITASTGRIVEIQLNPPDVRPLPQTLDAIANADLITIGPGSLFTSLVPNLLVHGIPEAIVASRAVKAFVCNLMTEDGRWHSRGGRSASNCTPETVEG